MKPGGVDYTETSPSAGTVTFITAPVAGSTILISYSKTIGQDVPKLLKQSYVTGTVSAPYTGSTTVFDLPFTYTPGSGSMLVFSGGVLMIVTSDYTETDSDTITFVSARTTGEIITFIKLGIASGESGGVVSNGTAGQIAYYSASGATVSGNSILSAGADGLVATVASAGNPVKFVDSVNGQTGYNYFGPSATNCFMAMSLNRNLFTGTAIKTGQTESIVTLESDNGVGSVTIRSSNTNNTSPPVVATFKESGVEIKGTTTNDSAAAGNVGEYVASVAASTSAPTTGQFGDLTSISLTAGDWDVTGMVHFDSSGATWSNVDAGISPSSGTSFASQVQGDNILRASWANTSTATTEHNLTLLYRVSISTTTTYYLKFLVTYSAGTPIGQGRISARRVR
jgi:hypothetical protein